MDVFGAAEEVAVRGDGLVEVAISVSWGCQDV
jgi:hypothetical protein